MTHTLAASAAHDQLAACDRDEIERQLSAMLRAIGEPCTLTPGQLGIAAAALSEAAEHRLDQADACPVCASWDEFCGPCRDLLDEATRLTEQARQLREEVALQCL